MRNILIGKDGKGIASETNAVPVDIISGGGGGADPVGLKNVAAATINPATEEKQDDIISAIGAIPAGGSVQYPDGDTPVTITGNALMWETDTGTNQVNVVNEYYPLPTDVVSGRDIEVKIIDANNSSLVANVEQAPSGSYGLNVINYANPSGVQKVQGVVVNGDVDANPLEQGNPNMKPVLAGSKTTDTIAAPFSTDRIVDLYSDLSGRLHVVPAFASAAAPTHTEGTQVPVRVTLGGDLVMTLDGENVAITASALPLPSGAATAAKQDTLLTELQLKADLTETQPVSIATMPTTPVTGTFWQTTQPVSGPLTDTQLRATAVPVSAASLPLPTGAATSALQTQPGVDIGDVTVNNASGASAVNIQDGGNSITVDGAIGLTGSVADVTQSGALTVGTLTDTLTIGNGVSAVALRVSGTWVGTVDFQGSVDATLWDPIYGVRTGVGIPYTSITEALNDNIFRFTTAGFRQVRAVFTRTSGTVTLAWRASVGTSGIYVNFPLPPGTNNIGIVSPPTVATATLANISASASSVTLMASNASRKMGTIYNDSTAILYVKFGAAASTTSFNVKMAADSYFEFPQPCYTGLVAGIWASAAGAARVMEV